MASPSSRSRRKGAAASAKREAVVLDREWQRWAAENLLRGVARAEIVATLREKGVAADAIERALAEIERSPIFEAARPFARDARRSAMYARLRRANARRAEGIARREGVGAAELHDVYVAGNHPVILTDVVTRWPALGRWTPRALAERYGDVLVDVTVDRESDPEYDQNAAKLTVSMPLRELVARIERGPSNDVYLIARGRALEKGPLGELLAEVVMPEGYLAMERALGCAQLWLGPEGTITPLHHDTSNILFAQVHGRKKWTLIAPWEPPILDRARSLYAGHDPEKDDLEGAIAHEVVLAPGEMLFVPVGWWHHVRALDASISLAFNNLAFANDYDWFRPGQIR